MDIQNSGGVIQFRLDSLMLQKFQDSNGFLPVIIDMQKLNDLSVFLGTVNPR
jgi:hypothetical protein